MPHSWLFVVQVLIYRALGWKQPQFSHVSLILAPDKSKLSKRHGATSLGEFRQEGYLPQAMLNYLTLLGWNDGSEQEVFTLQQLQVTSLPSRAASLLPTSVGNLFMGFTRMHGYFASSIIIRLPTSLSQSCMHAGCKNMTKCFVC